ncbi:transporter [Allosphingosinicella flava]|uniref:Transporter n=1 Tax=Allosphingosinicella flava TaxID=2771430 RepID=A0A7T2GL44_9SPHN|nr:transporter [Sphingosinicella flava]QPQ55861.1 transporter [Sphingosinicella flava]
MPARSVKNMANGLALAAMLTSAIPARAQSADIAEELRKLHAELKRQQDLLQNQNARIEAQQREIEGLKAGLAPGGSGAELAIPGLAPGTDIPDLSTLRGSGLVQTTPTGQPTVLSGPQLPEQPVGEAPPEPDAEVRARVEAIPQEQGVLTPTGRIVLEPSIEYTRSSTNRLVFRGIELVPGIQIGLIEASDADRDTIISTAGVRYGVTSRIEVEARLPYLYRRDRIEVAQQRDESIVRTIELKEKGIGDVEFGARYQLNSPRGQRPIWVASLRVKTNTGKGPFDIDYDEFGVATGLATGSGFWAIQPGLNFLLPSDPVVIYGGGSYLYHLPADVNRLVGEALIGRVDPGDAISANVGFGFALNPRFSYSLGYRHTYLMRTKTEINDTTQFSNTGHVGSLNMGLSYRLTPRQSVNLGFEFGVTSDAPDVSITLKIPTSF